jgi:hypothetical protein
MALGCGLTSVRGNRGYNYNNEPLVNEHIKRIAVEISPNQPYQTIPLLAKYILVSLSR